MISALITKTGHKKRQHLRLTIDPVRSTLFVPYYPHLSHFLPASAPRLRIVFSQSILSTKKNARKTGIEPAISGSLINHAKRQTATTAKCNGMAKRLGTSLRREFSVWALSRSSWASSRRRFVSFPVFWQCCSWKRWATYWEQLVEQFLSNRLTELFQIWNRGMPHSWS